VGSGRPVVSQPQACGRQQKNGPSLWSGQAKMRAVRKPHRCPPPRVLPVVNTAKAGVYCNHWEVVHPPHVALHEMKFRVLTSHTSEVGFRLFCRPPRRRHVCEVCYENRVCSPANRFSCPSSPGRMVGVRAPPRGQAGAGPLWKQAQLCPTVLRVQKWLRKGGPR